MMIEREWVDIVNEDDDWVWRFDVTFLLSGWGCIYGRGCPGTFFDNGKETPSVGCCGIGFVPSDSQDKARIETLSYYRLQPDEWENHAYAQTKGIFKRTVKDDDGNWEYNSRVHNKACIFLNRSPDDPSKRGCSLHLAALRRNEDPLDWKPEVCWQVPIQLDFDEENEVVTVYAMENEDWSESGEEQTLDWWCMSDGKASNDSELPYFKRHYGELKRVIKNEKMSLILFTYLEERWSQMNHERAKPDWRPVSFISRKASGYREHEEETDSEAADVLPLRGSDDQVLRS